MLIHHDRPRSEPGNVELRHLTSGVIAIILFATIVWLGHALLNSTDGLVEHVQAPAAVPETELPQRINSVVFGDEPGRVAALPAQERVRAATFVRPGGIGGLTIEIVNGRLEPVATHDVIGDAAINVDDLPAGTYRVIFAWEAVAAAIDDAEVSAAGMAISDDMVIEAGDRLVIDKALPAGSMLASVADVYSIVVRSPAHSIVRR